MCDVTMAKQATVSRFEDTITWVLRDTYGSGVSTLQRVTWRIRVQPYSGSRGGSVWAAVATINRKSSRNTKATRGIHLDHR